MSMNYPVFSRNFQVDFFERGEGLWHVTSHLRDHVHDILVTLDISAPEMVIRDADVKFIRYPLEGCLKMIDQMKKIVGTNLFTDFREKLTTHFAGSVGCYNVMNLISIAAPALIFFYFPNIISQGKMKPEEWWGMVHTKLAGNCVAH